MSVVSSAKKMMCWGKQVEDLLQQAEHEDEFGAGDSDDITMTNVMDEFRSLGLEEEGNTDDIQDYFSQVPINHDYDPFLNKLMMLLDILDNLPQLRMSSNQFKMILWLLKEAGVAHVPSYAGFRKLQNELRDLCGSTPQQHTSSLGNIFYVNDVRESVVWDFANPEIAKHLHLYPEETTGPISEVWQAEHWKEFKPSELTPMFSRGLWQFFIDEVSELDDGRLAIPRNWIMRNGELHADSNDVVMTPYSCKSVQVLLHRLETAPVPTMPNKLRELAGDNDLVVVMIPLWADDVCGNKSKQYNKHINIYSVNSNLPGKLLQQEFFVRFVSTSPHATSPEQFSVLKDQIKQNEIVVLFCGSQDYPLIIHSSLKKLHTWGVMPTVPAVNALQEGQVGIKRTANNIRAQLEKQIDLAIPSRIGCFHLCQSLFASPILSIHGLDPSQDTPVEILHTILLGIVKYVWYMLHSNWSEVEQNLFTIRFQSTDIDGLSVPPIRAAYVMQYRNALIGKHFKTQMQTLPFHVHDITSPSQFALVKAVAELGALLWVHEIDDMKQYLSDLEILIGNVLDAFGDVDPAKIIIKMKLHILPHIIEDILRYGPAIRNSTEHILSGGYWKQDGVWVQAGESVQMVLQKDPIIQRHLGWVPPLKIVSGSVRCEGKKKSPPIPWTETKASNFRSGVTSTILPDSLWRQGLSLTAQSGDQCSILSWVFARDNQEKLTIGGICEIIMLDIGTSSAQGLVTLELFNVGSEPHPAFNLPVLSQPPDGPTHIVISTQATALQAQRQEHELTLRMNKFISHADDNHFLICTYALHNANMLHQALPCILIRLKPLYEDRRAHHYDVAARLHISQTAKRSVTQQKRKATLAAKKARNEALNLNNAHSDLEPEAEDLPNEDGGVEGVAGILKGKRKRQ
ncbi:hypothetical protein K443DRAFT_122032 [Laccaria amethystina LaAM-08-1]|uniref:Uncharacterized protein n=1 Tax=Laccaria amethystina LaAM-08-1 TaxID=1095629 RepID=A0A0C9WT49_9AGAR|nr:hypothetical protein K443DRAFT_122032 [Laccaria amethystina LaAM-08-1]